MDEETVNAEIGILVEALKKVGYEEEGSFKAKFGDIFSETVDTLEALNGTLRAAKKRNIVLFKKQMLMQGVDNEEIVTLVKE